jgi:uncharacterized membrane protein SirB2
MLKTIHITTVLISILLFLSRGFWIYLLKKQLSAKWIRVLPHVNDSVLLGTGIALAIQTQQYPLQQDWLTVKIVCLLIYILLGMLAMKWYQATSTGMASWLTAIIIYLFMISVAVTRQPTGIFY